MSRRARGSKGCVSANPTVVRFARQKAFMVDTAGAFAVAVTAPNTADHDELNSTMHAIEC